MSVKGNSNMQPKQVTYNSNWERVIPTRNIKRYLTTVTKKVTWKGNIKKSAYINSCKGMFKR